MPPFRPSPASRPLPVPSAPGRVKHAAGTESTTAGPAGPATPGVRFRGLEACAPPEPRHLGAPAPIEAPDDGARRRAAQRAGDVGRVHSWELVTAVDGPGTRLTVFLAGCPLRCLYCHNPDTMQARSGELTEVSDIAARLARYRPALLASGGGVTISGGEPLQQPAFTSRLLAEAKRLGLHTAIDTSGFLGANADELLLSRTDLVLLDVKSGLPGTYERATGRALAPTLAFGDRLAERGIAAWIRFVLVPGLTDDPANIAAAARQITRWPNVERVEVLPYHAMGEAKWADLGMTYQLAGTPAPSKDQVAAACQVFADHGLPVTHG